MNIGIFEISLMKMQNIVVSNVLKNERSARHQDSKFLILLLTISMYVQMKYLFSAVRTTCGHADMRILRISGIP